MVFTSLFKSLEKFLKKTGVFIFLSMLCCGLTSCASIHHNRKEVELSSQQTDFTEKVNASDTSFRAMKFITGALSLERPLIEYSSTKGKLTSIHILDFNGFSETITNKQRLLQFSQKDFTHPQQYKKVLRVFKKNTKEATETITIITSYHENGQIHRYVECLNGRACGNFREWHENGQEKINALVVAGAADLDEKSIDSWTFDGPSIAKDSRGKLLGIFNYKKGLLDGFSITYSSSGHIEWITEYAEGKRTGIETRQKDDGSIIEEIAYTNGLRDGISRGYWPSGQLKYQEDFTLDLLQEGVYYKDHSSAPISRVTNRNGIRTVFDDQKIRIQYQITDGKRQGIIYIYNNDESIIREYSEIDGKKQGKDILYYSEKNPSYASISDIKKPPQPKLSIEWRQGIVTGLVETWYPNGSLESRREMKQNERDGISMCWYPDGSMMIVEEYEKGSLKKGRYHRKGELDPYSSVNQGKGIATLFDQDGHIMERIEYCEGKPIVKE